MANELIVLQPAQYPALDPNNDRVKTIIANLAGEQLSVADFNRIKVPSSGGTKWTIETAAGEEMAETLEGVILHNTRRRAYWENPNPSQTPPDCASADMVTGIGSPGGPCDACPFNQFGSAKNGHGKACKEVRLFFLLRKGQVLPDVVSVPPGSLKNVRKYLTSLPVPFWGVVTQLALVKANNADNVAYAKIAPKMVGALDEASRTVIVETMRRFEQAFQQVAVEREDADDEETQTV
jgi:hypothetical protein